LSLFDTDYSPNNVTWLQALPLGTYQHPRYGELKITPDKVSNLAKSFKDNVREIDIDVDYDHKQHTGKAAGWVKDAEARTDGLWVAVQWTEDAYASLKKGEYKYFSSEFDDVWTHPKTKQKHQDVLFGGAITNRPFVKDILPINLTEVLSNEGGTVDEALRQLLRKKYQLAEDADDATILAAVALDEQDEPAEEESDEEESDEDESDEEETELSEDDDPRIVQLMEQNKAQAKRLMVLENATKLSETKRKLAEINSAGSKYAIPPKVLKELEPVLVKLSDKEQDAILKQFMILKDNGLVELGERGGNDPDSQAGDESKRLWDKVEKLQKDNPKLSETDALMQVAETNPEMYEKYRSASYLKPKGE
jgi:hypothetical protein